MVRRSILSPALQESSGNLTTFPPPSQAAPSAIKPSRMAKLHIGGYFDPSDPSVVAFQKLKVDLRRSQQEMLLDAIRDFVAKHEAGKAFR
jgi:hypothetical protein